MFCFLDTILEFRDTGIVTTLEKVLSMGLAFREGVQYSRIYSVL